MIQYILECIAFQLVFLVIYDFFLKRETFFQWNRAYLIGTYLLSLFLPWVKIEAFKTTVPERYVVYPEYLWNANDALGVAANGGTGEVWSWETVVFLMGAVVATVLFGYKMWQLYRLRSDGEVRYFNEFTRIVIADSRMAFSFLKSIFLGDKVVAGDHENIIRHELVHIRQRHTWDLLYFEMMRIIGWFNPLVYVYQNRVSELHEFIADAEVAKGDKGVHYEYLLSQVFQAQNISFINPFFKSSLIKKRIVMLQMSKSNKIWKLKYLVLVPAVIGILSYTALESQQTVDDIVMLDEMVLVGYGGNGKTDDAVSSQGSYNNSYLAKKRLVDSNISMIFPGCEGVENTSACFQEKFMQVVGRNFRYPKEAQENNEQGTVLATFTVNENGMATNLRTRTRETRDTPSALRTEVARLVASLPTMLPKNSEAKITPTQFTIAFTFELR
ncbi:M56 family metallopeptidase [Pareuzebyella sediminis]|uniref:M56 family metallopeptidase n=1 Tax=Pareuzebyella sediminis TaxID=2607998 RepID=UPI0011EF5F4C|nr:M56 family metallopeptidase [Pareuzebyella sediminis]